MQETMQKSTDIIVLRLQEILASEAAKHFHDVKVLDADFKAYLVELTKVVDWEDEFIEEVHNLYLQKITDTGNNLSQKLSM
jgi:hypothetical protein